MADYKKAKDIFIERKRVSGTFEEYPLIVEPNSFLVISNNNDLVMLSMSASLSSSVVSSSYSTTASYAMNGGTGTTVSASWASHSLSSSNVTSNTSSIEYLQTKKLSFLDGASTILIEAESTDDNITITTGGFRIENLGNMIFSIDGLTGEVTASSITADIINGTVTNSKTASALVTGNNYNVNSLIINDRLSNGIGNPIAVGSGSHAEGDAAEAHGIGSHAEGTSTYSMGQFSHAEGDGCTAGAIASHAEGGGTAANGADSHAEGLFSQTVGDGSHAEGESCISIGGGSHAEGISTRAVGQYSHTEGNSTVASGSFQHTSGQYNSQGNTSSLFIIGNGTSDTNRSDVFLVNSQSVIVNAILDVIGNISCSVITASLLRGTASFAVSASYVNGYATTGSNVFSGSETIVPTLTGSIFLHPSGFYAPTVIQVKTYRYGTKTLTWNTDAWYSPDFASSISNLNPAIWLLSIQSSVLVTASVNGMPPDDARLVWGGYDWLSTGETIPPNISSSAIRNGINVVGNVSAWNFYGTATKSESSSFARTASYAVKAISAGVASSADYATTAGTSDGPWSNSGVSLSSINKQYFSPLVASTVDIDWNTSNVQDLTLANDVNTVTFTNGLAGSRYLLFLRQPTSGNSGSVIWPDTSSVKWPSGTEPTLTATNNKTDIIGFVYDGTIYYGNAALNF